MTSFSIALFVYNRPHHTHKTLESLMANAELFDSPLYVFCDGAKRKKDIRLVQAARELIRSYELDTDLYLSPYFLEYMNTALATYEEYDTHAKLHVPCRRSIASSFFYPATSCGGWKRGKLRAETLFSEEVQEKKND